LGSCLTNTRPVPGSRASNHRSPLGLRYISRVRNGRELLQAHPLKSCNQPDRVESAARWRVARSIPSFASSCSTSAARCRGIGVARASRRNLSRTDDGDDGPLIIRPLSLDHLVGAASSVGGTARPWSLRNLQRRSAAGIHRATRNNYFRVRQSVARLCYRMRKVSLGRAGT
jgi:hypothetical protein